MVPPASDRAPPTPPYSGYRPGWQGFRVRGCHPLRRAFPGGFRYPRFFHVACPTTPRAPRRPRFGLAPFRSPLLGGSLLFSSPPPTWMFRFGGFASPHRVMPCLRMAGCPIRTPADLRPFAPPRRLSRPAASFLASGSQGILRAPSLASRSSVSTRSLVSVFLPSCQRTAQGSSLLRVGCAGTIPPRRGPWPHSPCPSRSVPASTEGGSSATSAETLQKGGVPAAPSGTATLLRLSPSHPVRPRRVIPGFRRPRLPWLDGRCVQGPGTYSPRHG